MGMYYYLIPERKTECTNDFPSGLSHFFEQVGGYGEYATVSQLENELEINLSIFQNIYNEGKYVFQEMEKYGIIENAEKELNKHKNKTKINTKLFLDIILNFKNKLTKNKDFVRKIKFNNNKTLPEKIRVLCPPEIEYYNNGEFLKDLNTLIFTIECYKNDGIKYLRLGYE